LFINIWRFTFRVPPRDIKGIPPAKEVPQGPHDPVFELPDDEVEASPVYDDETRKKADDLIGRINHAKFNVRRTGRLATMKNIDFELLSLMGEEYKFGKYSVRLFFEVKYDLQLLGKYNYTRGKVLVYEGGKFCDTGHHYSGGEVRFVCSNVTKLIEFTEYVDCRFEAVLVTPAVCTPSAGRGFEGATVEELRRIARSMGVEYPV
jgi:hypothetical protein